MKKPRLSWVKKPREVHVSELSMPTICPRCGVGTGEEILEIQRGDVRVRKVIRRCRNGKWDRVEQCPIILVSEEIIP